MKLAEIIYWEPGMPLPAPVLVLDAGAGACCPGAAEGGPLECTCWEPVYDLEQQDPRPGLPLPALPPRMCGDCAYQPGSPERRGDDPSYQGTREHLDELVENGQPFWCHAGMRRPLKYVHPSGAEIDGHPASYSPPILDGIPYKADGSPAELCSGWLLRRAAVMRRAGVPGTADAIRALGSLTLDEAEERAAAASGPQP